MDIEQILRRLERRLRYTQVGLAGTILILIAVAAGWLSLPSTAIRDANVLHTRGLVIEDAGGHPRLLLGAPVHNIPGRRRLEDVNGIVLLGENGADRVLITYPGIEPQ